jgi:hypothetical protein
VRVLLIAGTDNFNAYAVVVVYAANGPEDIDMNSTEFRVDSLVNAAVAINDILSTGMPHPPVPTVDYPLSPGNTAGLGRMQDDVADRQAPFENAA